MVLANPHPDCPTLAPTLPPYPDDSIVLSVGGQPGRGGVQLSNPWRIHDNQILDDNGPTPLEMRLELALNLCLQPSH